MANAVKEELYIVNLELDRNETETLLAVLSSIAGSPDTSRRKHVNSILNALSSAGVRRPENRRDLVGTLTFG